MNGERELLPLLGRLGQDPVFRRLHGREGGDFEFTEAERANARAQGRRVLLELLERSLRLRDVERNALADIAGTQNQSHAGGGAVLVFLDNVDQPALLSQAQHQDRSELNEAHECIRFIATSRIGADQWRASPVDVLPLDRLNHDEALQLMKRHRREEESAWPPDESYERGVIALVHLLDGYTLLVEQVALYLAHNPDIRPEALLDAFRLQGLTEGDALHRYDDRLHDAVRHREKLFSVVLDQTLRALDGLPLARAALDYAAWLPPEHVSWAWLEGMLREDAPQAFDVQAHVPSPWLRATQRLRALQLLAEAADGVARLHRLLRDHLRARDSGEQEKRRIRIYQFLLDRSIDLDAAYQHQPAKWSAERVAARELATHWIREGRKDALIGVVCGVAGGIESKFGSIAAAFELLEWAVACHDGYRDEGIPSDTLEQQLTVSLERLADLRFTHGDAPGALMLLERGLGYWEERLAKDPDLLRAKSRVAQFRLRIALAIATTNSARAGELFETAKVLCEEVYEADQVTFPHRQDFAISLQNLGVYLIEHGAAVAPAIQLLSRATSLFREDYRMSSRSAQARRLLAMGLGDLAYAKTRRKRPDNNSMTRSAFKRGLVLFERTLREQPKSPEAMEDVAGTLVRIADWITISHSEQDACVVALLERSARLRHKIFVLNRSPGNATRLRRTLQRYQFELAKRGRGLDSAVAELISTLRRDGA